MSTGVNGLRSYRPWTIKSFFLAQSEILRSGLHREAQFSCASRSSSRRMYVRSKINLLPETFSFGKRPYCCCPVFSRRAFVALTPKLVHLLEVGLIINIRSFPAFRVAFEPAAVKWDFDPSPFIQRASDAHQGGASELGLSHRGVVCCSDHNLFLA